MYVMLHISEHPDVEFFFCIWATLLAQFVSNKTHTVSDSHMFKIIVLLIIMHNTHADKNTIRNQFVHTSSVTQSLLLNFDITTPCKIHLLQMFQSLTIFISMKQPAGFKQ